MTRLDLDQTDFSQCAGYTIYLHINFSSSLGQRSVLCVRVTHLRLTNTTFCVPHARMDHCEAHLMVTPILIDCKGMRMAIWDFFLMNMVKRQNGECNVRNV